MLLLGVAFARPAPVFGGAPPAVRTLAAHDSLAEPQDANPDALRCLQALAWKPADFTVTCRPVSATGYDFLIEFPSAVPSGDETNDRVSMEWYAARDEQRAIRKAPAVLVVHESGRSMPVGRLFARGLQASGWHAFLIHLPYYGPRAGQKRQPEIGQLFTLLRQGLADVRRGRDALAALPEVDSRHIALQGTSLGGFVATLVGSLDHGFQSVFIMLAGGNLYEMFQHGQREVAQARRELEKAGLAGDKLRELLWPVEPTRIAHRLDRERTWLFTAERDQVVPLEHAQALARAAHLDDAHHIRLAADHYTGIIYFPTILRQVNDQIRTLMERDGHGR